MLSAWHYRSHQAGDATGSGVVFGQRFSTVRKITDALSAPSPCPLPRGAREHRTVISRTVLATWEAARPKTTADLACSICRILAGFRSFSHTRFRSVTGCPEYLSLRPLAPHRSCTGGSLVWKLWLPTGPAPVGAWFGNSGSPPVLHRWKLGLETTQPTPIFSLFPSLLSGSPPVLYRWEPGLKTYAHLVPHPFLLPFDPTATLRRWGPECGGGARRLVAKPGLHRCRTGGGPKRGGGASGCQTWPPPVQDRWGPETWRRNGNKNGSTPIGLDRHKLNTPLPTPFVRFRQEVPAPLRIRLGRAPRGMDRVMKCPAFARVFVLCVMRRLFRGCLRFSPCRSRAVARRTVPGAK